MSASLYERIGGAAAVDAAVGAFYQRVLADPGLAPLFDGIPMDRMHAHQRRFLTFAFGGSDGYAGKGLRKAHADLIERHGLSDVHFDGVIEHLRNALDSLHVPSELVREVTAVANSVRDDVLGR